MSDDDHYVDLYDESPDDFEGDYYLGSDHGGEFNAPSFDENTLPTKKQKDEIIEGLEQPHAARKELLRDFADGDDTDVGGTALDIAKNAFVTLNSDGRMSDAVYFPIRAADLDAASDCVWLQRETDRINRWWAYHSDRSWNQIRSRIRYRNRDPQKKRRDRFTDKQRRLEKMGHNTHVAYDMAERHEIDLDIKKFTQLCLDCFAEYLTIRKDTLRKRKNGVADSVRFFVTTLENDREEVCGDMHDRALSICNTRLADFLAEGYRMPDWPELESVAEREPELETAPS